jgi:predicted MFS family arabinose efflux permease
MSRLWLRVVLPFAGGYLLSYLYRTVNAVAGPVLAQELGLSSGALGLLTSAYFVAFGLAQIPLGVLLDRYGARRVESTLLLVAAAGAALFATAEDALGLALGRAVIGLGVSACLMAAFKAFSQVMPADRQASLTGWIMSAGSLGALVASSPLEAAIAAAGWREVFAALAGITLLVSAWLRLSVPELPAAAPAGRLAVQLRELQTVFASRRLRRFAPLGFALIGGFMAVQGLWATVWMTSINALDRAEAAQHLATMNLAMLATYVGVGLLAHRLAHRGITPLHLMVGGLGLSLTALLLVLLEAGTHTAWLWAAYGIGSCFGTLSYSQMARGFPLALAGRAHTAFNLAVFAGGFTIQWGYGVLLDALTAAGLAPADALRVALGGLWLLQLASYAWFVAGWRKDLAEPAAT